MRALLLALAVASAAHGKELYEVVGPFGPKEVAFPWHCAFSPDGKWIAFIDGHTSYFTIWDFELRKEVWAGDPPNGAHQVGWSGDSNRAATITRDAFVGVERGEDGWKLADSTPLGFQTTIAASTSPSPFHLRWDAKYVMFAEDGRSYSITVGSAAAKDLTTKGETVFQTLGLGEHGVAFAKLAPLQTEVLNMGTGPGRGTKTIRAVVLAGSPDGNLWLVANNRKQLERGSSISLEVAKTDSGKSVAKLKASGQHPRGLVQALFSPDSKLLATVEGSGDIVLRDATTAKPVQTIREYKRAKYAMGVAFSPDGQWLVTGGRRGGGEGDDHGTLLWKRVDAE